jgi:hypothetical protein
MPMRFLLAAALALATFAARADLSDGDLASAARLREAALASPLAYELVTSLTTEVGARMAGSEADPRAVAWAVARLKSLGFANVRAESFTLSAWKRGAERAEITSPYPQRLVVTALGNSVPTPAEGLEAEVAYYPDLAALRADKSDRARGKIVFIDQKTERRRFGATYGSAVAARTAGASEAARHGAIACVIRSIGTDHDRFAHTGVMIYESNVPKIPAAAVSIPDADVIARIARQPSPAAPLRLRLALATEPEVAATSSNVIGEIEGSDLAKDIVLIGAHLDSWDLGTGAIDDGAGVGIVVGAAKAILAAGLKPRRTIRVVLFGNEEKGLDGSRSYGEKYKDIRHQMVGESDFGAGRPWRFSTRVLPSALPVMAQVAAVLAPLDMARGDNESSTGPDADFLVRRHGWPTLHPDQDGSDYFNYHHTPNDTLDKVDPAAMRANAAAWAVIAWLAAQADVDFGPLPRDPGR